MGNKGFRHICQQNFKVAFIKLYDRKNALVATEMFNDKVKPFFEYHDLRLLRVLTDSCGTRELHEYQLHLAIKDIDHSNNKAKSQQINGICERFHRAT